MPPRDERAPGRTLAEVLGGQLSLGDLQEEVVGRGERLGAVLRLVQILGSARLPPPVHGLALQVVGRELAGCALEERHRLIAVAGGHPELGQVVQHYGQLVAVDASILQSPKVTQMQVRRLREAPQRVQGAGLVLAGVHYGRHRRIEFQGPVEVHERLVLTGAAGEQNSEIDMAQG